MTILFALFDKANITNPSTRGLGIYIKNTVPSKVVEDKRDNTCAEYLGFEIFLEGKTNTIINVKPHDGEVVPKPERMILGDTVLLFGDFNARYLLLGFDRKTKMVRFIICISKTLVIPYTYYVLRKDSLPRTPIRFYNCTISTHSLALRK